MSWQTIFWCVLSAMYLALWVTHVVLSRKTFNQLPKRPMIAEIEGVSTGVPDTRQDINEFIDNLNVYNKRMGMTQFWGYLAAFIAALFGVIASLYA
ncbi:MAG: hypothetical protein JXB43_05530 [Dehalococcoidia bacterium]|nr:hypothetical protein [Dehalococcoidia bacterium]